MITHIMMVKILSYNNLHIYMYTRIIFFHKNLRVRNIIIRIYIDGVRSVMCVNKTFNFLNMINKEYYTKYFVSWFTNLVRKTQFKTITRVSYISYPPTRTFCFIITFPHKSHYTYNNMHLKLV